MPKLFDTPHAIRYVSHRGFQPMAPANSLPGFAYAGLLGQWAIETDVRQTRDGVLVCCHDAAVESTFDGEGVIAEMTWAELSRLRMNRGHRLDCLRDGEKRMPLFAEYLAICKRYGSVPFIELKSPDVGSVLAAVRAAGLTSDEVVISAIPLDWLLETRRQDRDVFLHWIFAREERVGELVSAGNAGLSWDIPDAFACPREKVDQTHALGLKICLRAGDTVASVRRMEALGLDYIPSNCMHLPLKGVENP